MNLEYFKKFVWLHELIRGKDPRMEPMPLSTFKEKMAVYEHAGALTEEQRELMRQQQHVIQMRMIDEGLARSQFFEIDKVEKRLMLLTDAPTDKRILDKLRLPFPAMFLDIHIDESELSEAGMNCQEIQGILLVETNITEQDESLREETFNDILQFKERGFGDKVEVLGRQLYIAFLGIHRSPEGDRAIIQQIFIDINSGQKYWYGKDGLKEKAFFTRFLQNFLTFINHPEVKVIKHERTVKGNERRMKQGKQPLPSSNTVKLTGRMYAYAEEHRERLMADKIDYATWCRGHWRHYTSEKRPNVKGTAIWIEPFIRGAGELRKHNYALEARKDDEKKYRNKFLFLDDVKPLDKPLSEMTGGEREKARKGART